MIDITNYKTEIGEEGDIVVVKVRGGTECLWMNVYIDMEDANVCVNSDIGAYARCVGHARGISRFEEKLLAIVNTFDTDYSALKNYCNSSHIVVDVDQTMKQFEELVEYGAISKEMCDNIAEAVYSIRNPGHLLERVDRMLDEEGFEVDDLSEYIAKDYGVFPSRFAEIMSAIVAPELKEYFNLLNVVYWDEPESTTSEEETHAKTGTDAPIGAQVTREEFEILKRTVKNCILCMDEMKYRLEIAEHKLKNKLRN